jgi:ComF family protein
VAERPAFDRLYGSVLYETPVGSAIKALKFDDVRALGGMLAGMFDVEALSRSEAEMVVPVPMHKTRLRSRGFNQSEILGRKLAQRVEIAFRSDVLVRTIDTMAQSEQPTAAARRSTLAGGFSVEPGAVKTITGKRLLLVGDVFTTGSTASACAEALKSAGASWVGVVALAVQPIGGLK